MAARFLTDTDALEQRLTGELRASEERLSRRMTIIEQRLAENEQVLRRLGHQIARIQDERQRWERALQRRIRVPAATRGSRERSHSVRETGIHQRERRQ